LGSPYATPLERDTADLVDAVGSLRNPITSGFRRLLIHEMMFSCPDDARDDTIKFVIQDQTTAPTSGATVTPHKRPEEIAAVAIGNENPTTNGALTANAIHLEFGMNTRSIFRWYVPDGDEIIVPAADSDGIAILTPVAQNTPSIIVNLRHRE